MHWFSNGRQTKPQREASIADKNREIEVHMRMARAVRWDVPVSPRDGQTSCKSRVELVMGRSAETVARMSEN